MPIDKIQQEEMEKRINHTAKLVTESQRELFISEINQIINLAVANERKKVVGEIKVIADTTRPNLLLNEIVNRI